MRCDTRHSLMLRLNGGNPVGGKGFLEQAKEAEVPPFWLLGVLKNTKLNNHSERAEDLALTHTGSWIAASFSVSAYESCLVDSVFYGLICWCPRTPLAPVILSPPLLQGLLRSAWWSFLEDNWVRHQLMSIGTFHFIDFLSSHVGIYPTPLGHPASSFWPSRDYWAWISV